MTTPPGMVPAGVSGGTVLDRIRQRHVEPPSRPVSAGMSLMDRLRQQANVAVPPSRIPPPPPPPPVSTGTSSRTLFDRLRELGRDDGNADTDEDDESDAGDDRPSGTDTRGNGPPAAMRGENASIMRHMSAQAIDVFAGGALHLDEDVGQLAPTLVAPPPRDTQSDSALLPASEQIIRDDGDMEVEEYSMSAFVDHTHAWHSLPRDDLLRILGADLQADGLIAEEVRSQRLRVMHDHQGTLPPTVWQPHEIEIARDETALLLQLLGTTSTTASDTASTSVLPPVPMPHYLAGSGTIGGSGPSSRSNGIGARRDRAAATTQHMRTFYDHAKAAVASLFADDPLDLRTPYGKPPAQYGMIADLRARYGHRFDTREHHDRMSDDRMPRNGAPEIVTREYLFPFRLPPVEGDRVCRNGAACMFRVRADEERRPTIGYVGREFVLPSVLQAWRYRGEVPSTDEQPLGRCIECTLKNLTDRARGNGQVKAMPTHPINNFVVSCDEGEYSPDVLLPISLDGSPTGISGLVPEYHAHQRQYLPLPRAVANRVIGVPLLDMCDVDWRSIVRDLNAAADTMMDAAEMDTSTAVFSRTNTLLQPRNNDTATPSNGRARTSVGTTAQRRRYYYLAEVHTDFRARLSDMDTCLGARKFCPLLGTGGHRYETTHRGAFPLPRFTWVRTMCAHATVTAWRGADAWRRLVFACAPAMVADRHLALSTGAAVVVLPPAAARRATTWRQTAHAEKTATATSVLRDYHAAYTRTTRVPAVALRQYLLDTVHILTYDATHVIPARLSPRGSRLADAFARTLPPDGPLAALLTPDVWAMWLDVALAPFEGAVARVWAACDNVIASSRDTTLCVLLWETIQTARGNTGYDTTTLKGGLSAFMSRLHLPPPLDRAESMADMVRAIVQNHIIWATAIVRTAILHLASVWLVAAACDVPRDGNHRTPATPTLLLPNMASGMSSRHANERAWLRRMLRLHTSTHLDLLHVTTDDDVFLDTGGDDTRLPAVVRVWPSLVRIVCGEELPDLTAFLTASNPWFDTSNKKGRTILLRAIIHVFFCKIMNQVCQRRRFLEILIDVVVAFSVLAELVRLIFHVTLLGHWPNATGAPVALEALIRLNALGHFKGYESIVAFIQRHPLTIMCALREYFFMLAEGSGPFDTYMDLLSTRWSRFKTLARQSATSMRRYLASAVLAVSRADASDVNRIDWSLIENDVDDTGLMHTMHQQSLGAFVKLKKGRFEELLLNKIIAIKKNNRLPKVDVDAIEAWLGEHDRHYVLHLAAWAAARVTHARDTVATTRADERRLHCQRVVFPTRWLQPFVSEETMRTLREWIVMYQVHGIRDNPFTEMALNMFCTATRDMIIVQYYLTLIDHYRQDATFYLPIDQFARNARVLRQNLQLDPRHDATPPLTGIVYACPRCKKFASHHSSVTTTGQWGPIPTFGTNAHAVALASAYFDPQNGHLYCNRCHGKSRRTRRQLSAISGHIMQLGLADVMDLDMCVDLMEDVMDHEEQHATTRRRRRRRAVPAHPTNDDSTPGNVVYASAVANTLLTRYMGVTPGQPTRLIAKSMLGVWRRIHHKLYGLCVLCGVLTEVVGDRMTHMGIVCASHRLPRTSYIIAAYGMDAYIATATAPRHTSSTARATAVLSPPAPPAPPTVRRRRGAVQARAAPALVAPVSMKPVNMATDVYMAQRLMRHGVAHQMGIGSCVGCRGRTGTLRVPVYDHRRALWHIVLCTACLANCRHFIPIARDAASIDTTAWQMRLYANGVRERSQPDSIDYPLPPTRVDHILHAVQGAHTGKRRRARRRPHVPDA